MLENKTKQELFCHNCRRYVQFEMDLSINDNYDIVCPNCGHHHYRVVINGVITETRWGRDTTQQQFVAAYPNYTTISSGTTTAFSTYSTYDSGTTAGTGSYYLYTSWMDVTPMQ